MISEFKIIVKLKATLSKASKFVFFKKFFGRFGGFKSLKNRVTSVHMIVFFSFCFLIVVFLYFAGYLTKISNGFVETYTYLNSLPESEKLEVWSNSKDFCAQIKGGCTFGSEVPKYREFDYFVFFVNQNKKFITDDGDFSELKNYSSKTITVAKRKELLTKAVLVKNSDVPAELLPAPAEFTFAIIGDSQRVGLVQKETAQFQSILENIQKFKPDFLLAMGDLTPDYDCDTPEQCRPNFEKWRSNVEKYVPVVYPAFGNHDEGNKARFFWNEIFSLPKNGFDEIEGTTYSLDFKNSQFIFIDSEKAFQQEEETQQFQWLKKELESSRQRNKFVISHATDFNRAKPRQVHKWKTLVENGVFAQFSGHTHVFCYRKAQASEFQSEGDVINIFIVGNSGSMSHPYPPDCEVRYRNPHFAIAKIKGSSMTVTAYDDDGKEIGTTNSINANYFPWKGLD